MKYTRIPLPSLIQGLFVCGKTGRQRTDLTGVLGGGLEEAAQVLFFIEHMLGALVNAVGQREVGVPQKLLARVDDDLLRVTGDAGHPWGVLHSDVVHDEPQYQAQQLVHVLARHHRHVIAAAHNTPVQNVNTSPRQDLISLTLSLFFFAVQVWEITPAKTGVHFYFSYFNNRLLYKVRKFPQYD